MAGINYLVVYAGSFRGTYKTEMQDDGSTNTVFFVTNCLFQYWKTNDKRTNAVQSALKGDFHLYMLTCIPANSWHFFMEGRVRRQLLLQCLPFIVFRDVWIRTLRAVAESRRSSPYLSTHRPNKGIYYALQMKGRWESNINFGFPFIYSQKWNCYLQNRIIMFCLLVPTLIYLWEIYIFPG